jgi:hypothetical protein
MKVIVTPPRIYRIEELMAGTYFTTYGGQRYLLFIDIPFIARINVETDEAMVLPLDGYNRQPYRRKVSAFKDWPITLFTGTLEVKL